MGSPAAETAEVTESAIVPFAPPPAVAVSYNQLVDLHDQDTTANTGQKWQMANIALKWIRDRN